MNPTILTREELTAEVRKGTHDLRSAPTPIIVLSERLTGEEGSIIYEAAQEALAICTRVRDLAEI